jgi:antitoxin (DNA-binding transcriptional repressor) of toxin-antitoxin stability system
MASATIFEAKTNLSELIKKAQAGEKVVITSGREKKPVAEITAIVPSKAKRLGALFTPGFELGNAFWEPLPDDMTGETEHKNDPLFWPKDSSEKLVTYGKK